MLQRRTRRSINSIVRHLKLSLNILHANHGLNASADRHYQARGPRFKLTNYAKFLQSRGLLAQLRRRPQPIRGCPRRYCRQLSPPLSSIDLISAQACIWIQLPGRLLCALASRRVIRVCRIYLPDFAQMDPFSLTSAPEDEPYYQRGNKNYTKRYAHT